MVDGIDAVQAALNEVRTTYGTRYPKSKYAFEHAKKVLPGGNTRSVLFYKPFPLTIVSGEGAEVFDLEGNKYIDFVGEFSAGLFGHTDPSISQAVIQALARGTVLAAPNELEVKLAGVIKDRFPSIDLLRFCNSGTEANILALTTSLAVTRRKRIIAFREAYHGGVVTYAGGGSPVNIPFDVDLAEYNNIESVLELTDKSAGEFAAIIVEPILGAGGNIPGRKDFLLKLRELTKEIGAILIFDEVKTSRCGSAGIQGLMGLVPDITTLGKYMGGGLSSGIIGGKHTIMSYFDPSRTDCFRHAGTFNNNVLSMAAGLAGLTQTFNSKKADDFLQKSEEFRIELNSLTDDLGVPAQFTGLGSMFTLHFHRTPIYQPRDVTAASRLLGQLFHLEALMQGVLVASRGDIYLSLPMSRGHLQRLKEVVQEFCTKHRELIDSVI